MKNPVWIILLSLAAVSPSCKDESVNDDGTFEIVSGYGEKEDEGGDTPKEIEIDGLVGMFSFDKTFYNTGDKVSCSFRLQAGEEALNVEKIEIIVKNISDTADPFHTVGDPVEVENGIVVAAGESRELSLEGFFDVPANGAGNVYAVYVVCTFEGDSTSDIFGSAFRVVDESTLITYKIEKTNYKGLPIYLLTGGMSAEFGVEKAVTSFAKGISHSWYPKDGKGPYPVWATLDFMELAIDNTVDLYNDVLGGATAKVKTVVIGTGVPSVPYLSATMNAAYLPIHFLASVNSITELEAVIDYTNRNIAPCYATVGYDGSMPEPGVAWIKLLDLPEAYRKFIADHQVEEVILWGVDESVPGETRAREVLRNGKSVENKYDAGSIYVQYTGYESESDITNLKNRLRDYEMVELGESQNIADWESGIISAQINNFADAVKENTQASVYSVVAKGDMIHIYDAATYLSLAYLKNNGIALGRMAIENVIFNEYLTSNPQFEIAVARIPVLYWQFNPVESTIGRVFGGYFMNAMNEYYPDVTIDDLKSLEFLLNSYYGKAGLEEELRGKGVSTISIRQGQFDVWAGEGWIGRSFCDIYAVLITDLIGIDNYRQKLGNCTPLTISELESIAGKIGGSASGLDFREL